jgi:hypothetical protein
MNNDQITAAINIAIGALVRMGGRKFQSGDKEEYAAIKALVMNGTAIMESRA